MKQAGWLLLGMSMLTGCGKEAAPAMADAADVVPVASLTRTIPVTRAQCTPFGNAPRPRQDSLALTNSLLCAGGGKRLPDWTDAAGTVRQACLYEPETASAARPLPLIFWLQGSALPAEVQLPVTNVLSQQASADLTGDPARKGFILIELAGRLTDHYYPAPNNTGTSGWDNWDRQLYPGAGARTVNGRTYAMNLDAAAIDHYIDQAVADGKVDPRRVYMMGWSNGAAMSILYAMNRPRIAAAAVYSSPNPYDALNDSCGQVPVAGVPRNDTEVQVFNPGVPIFHVINDCDIYSICPGGVALRDTLAATSTAAMKFQIINAAQSAADSCMAVCGVNPRGTDYTSLTGNLDFMHGGLPATLGQTLGIANHLRWPTSWTADYFTFLREHPQRD